MRIRLARGFWSSRFGLALLGTALVLLIAATIVLARYYIAFGHLIDQRLTGQIYQNTSRVYSAPGHIFTGESMHASDLSSYLTRVGYQEDKVFGAPGQFRVTDSTIEILPSSDSYFRGQNSLRVTFSGGTVSQITQLSDGASADSAQIEPDVITNLFDSSREKRRVVQFDDLPPVLVRAVMAAEDKRFFEHGPLDIIRVFGAAFADVSRGEKAQGASTIDMQVARTFFFTTKREWSRKLKEILMAAEIDQRFSKQQVFELYANDIYLGNRGSFSIRGFGEAAEAYFGKDVRDLDAGECAFLAGIIRAPNRYSTAERHVDRANEPRDRVLGQMVEDGYLTAEQEATAKRSKLKFVNGGLASSSAPYFVDMVKDHLLEEFSETDLQTQSYRIYTTLDPDLQRAASDAVQIGVQNVDKLLARRYAIWKKKGQPVPEAQVAMVVLDPRTGEIRALIGGRNYGESQLNHALARRQPGSAFKPFVYAAAFDNAVQGLQPVVTPVTTVDDSPTTFEFDGKEYTPDNYSEEFYGNVTVRDALMHSLNVATVKVAEMIGYDRVVAVARQMGLGNNIQATPAVALGAYEMTPIDVAGGYTAFASNGVRAEPLFIRSVISADGKSVESAKPTTRQVLDPRVAYLVTSLMEDVINHGTGYPVRQMGFTAPAAGKTGTSRDGWFAGYTSNLLCVVWVGFDDNRDLGLAGGATAAPIWGEFMKRATALPAYKDTKPFEPPSGIVEESIDPETGQLATPSCPQTATEYFIDGSQPTQYCQLHGGAQSGSWLSCLLAGVEIPHPNRITLRRKTLRRHKARVTRTPRNPRRKRVFSVEYLYSSAEASRRRRPSLSRSNRIRGRVPANQERAMRHPALFAVSLVFSAACIAATCGAQQANPPKTNSASSDSASDSSGRTPMTPRQIAEMHAQILMARKDYAEAAIAYQQLLESDPRNPDLLTTTGMAYEQLGNYDLAEHFYKSAIKTDKNFSHALNNLGTLEYSKKRYKQAITYYKKALVAGKDMAPIYTNLGYAYCSIKQYPLAMNAFSRAIAIDPTVLDQRGAGGTLGQQRTAANPGALNFYLAKSYAKAGDAEHAARYLKLARDEGYKNFRLAEKDPDFVPVIKDVRVQEVLREEPGYATAPAPQKPVAN